MRGPFSAPIGYDFPRTAGEVSHYRISATNNTADMESFFSSHGPASDAGATRVKVMRWPASVRLGHSTVLSAKAIQISSSGVGLLMDRTLREGETALVRVDAFVSGNPVRLQARTNVVCCTCVGMDGFRISLRFQELDDDAQTAVDALLGSGTR